LEHLTELSVEFVYIELLWETLFFPLWKYIPMFDFKKSFNSSENFFSELIKWNCCIGICIKELTNTVFNSFWF